MNLKVRFRNKVWVLTFIAALIALVYSVCNEFGISIPISDNTIMGWVGQIAILLTMLGVFIDPTTDGVSDSDQAMRYSIPKKDIE